MERALYHTDPPWWHVVVGDLDSLTEYVCSVPIHAPEELQDAVVVRLIRGAKMRTYPDLFDEVAAALQFPSYFGENWPALDECLNDLDWLPARAVSIVLRDAAEILRDAAGEWEEEDEGEEEPLSFFRLLDRTAAQWNQFGQTLGWRVRPPTPFHLVLHAANTNEASVLQVILDRAGIVYSSKVLSPVTRSRR